jgi:hypothetical protein
MQARTFTDRNSRRTGNARANLEDEQESEHILEEN